MKYRNILGHFGLCLGFLLTSSCANTDLENENRVQETNTSDTFANAKSLERTAIKLEMLYNQKNCKQFTDALPNNFHEFDELYGYDDEKGERRLYSKYQEHLSFFSECPQLSDREKLNKVVNIGINGKWEADATSVLQDLALNLIKRDPNSTKEILDNLSDAEASSFWFFLFDGPHPTDKQNLEKFQLLRKLLGEKSQQSKLLSEQFERLLVVSQNDK